jgi:hypothetical protein
MTRRSLIQRACVVLGLVALAAFLFYIGKGHTLLIDTNAVTIDDEELRSQTSVTVSVDGKKLNSSMGRAERVMVNVSGPKHTIVIVDDADTDKKVEKTFRIPTFMNMAVVSVPAILGNASAEHWVTLFTPRPVEDTPVEKMQYSR